MFSGWTVVTIEGLIGAGKSTLLDHLKKECVLGDVKKNNIVFMPEPVHYYSQLILPGGKVINPLQETYLNPKQNVAPFELHVLDSYGKSFDDILEHQGDRQVDPPILVMDRGLWGSYMITQTQEDIGFMTELGSQMFQQKLKQITHRYFGDRPYGCEKLFYMDVAIETCRGRLGRRMSDEPLGDNEDVFHDPETLKLMNKHHHDYVKEVTAKLGEGAVCVSNSTDLNHLASEFFNFVFGN